MREDIGFVRQLDTQIQRRREEITTLEQTKQIVLASEPEIASNESGTATKRRAGRPRSANAKKTGSSPGIKRGRGRPKGSKNKPKPSADAPSAPENAVGSGT